MLGPLALQAAHLKVSRSRAVSEMEVAVAVATTIMKSRARITCRSKKKLLQAQNHLKLGIWGTRKQKQRKPRRISTCHMPLSELPMTHAGSRLNKSSRSFSSALQRRRHGPDGWKTSSVRAPKSQKVYLHHYMLQSGYPGLDGSIAGASLTRDEWRCGKPRDRGP